MNLNIRTEPFIYQTMGKRLINKAKDRNKRVEKEIKKLKKRIKELESRDSAKHKSF